MHSVVSAILNDPEARGYTKTPATFGKLREPVLFITAAARLLGAQSDGVYLAQQSSQLGQPLFNPASVFNYYPPTYNLPDTNVLAPEFGIQNSSTAINRYNFANTLAFGTIAPITTLPGAVGTIPNWSTLSAVAADANALLDRLNATMMHGTMSAEMRAAILPGINAIPASNPLSRAKTAFYLVVTSAEYQVER
jgi:hypothetical protein